MQAFVHVGRLYCGNRNSSLLTSEEGGDLTPHGDLLLSAGSTPPPFFGKIRDLKNLDPLIRRIPLFDPQDVPDRPPLIRNILRITWLDDLCPSTPKLRFLQQSRDAGGAQEARDDVRLTVRIEPDYDLFSLLPLFHNGTRIERRSQNKKRWKVPRIFSDLQNLDRRHFDASF